ncbi:MAG: hypothetical protein R3E01_35020 [Pirellulaceae bacterium]
MLRWVVANWFRQSTQEALREFLRSAAAGSGDRESHGERPQDRHGTRDQKVHAESSLPIPVQDVRRDVAIVCALGAEAGGLVDRMQDVVTQKCSTYVETCGLLGTRSVVIAQCGIGQRHAAQATTDVITVSRPLCVISAGFAVALHDTLRRGQIVLGDSVTNNQRDALDLGLRLDPSVQQQPGLHVGRIATVNRLLSHPDEKQRLHHQTEAIVADLDTYAVATVCRQRGVPFLAVRVVSDVLADAMPSDLERLLGHNSLAGKLGAAAAALTRRPSGLVDLWQMKEDALKASDRLAKFLEQMSAQLPRHPHPEPPVA